MQALIHVKLKYN